MNRVTTRTITAEELAEMFHDIYEELAPQYGYVTRRSSAVAWKDVPKQNKELMIATADRVIRRLKGIEPR